MGAHQGRSPGTLPVKAREVVVDLHHGISKSVHVCQRHVGWLEQHHEQHLQCRLEVLHNVGCTGPGPLLLKLLVGQMTHASLGQSFALAVPHDQQVHTVQVLMSNICRDDLEQRQTQG